MISMSRLYTFAVVAALGIPSGAACQQSVAASSALGITIGVTDFHQHDDNLSPFTYRGALASAGAMYERRAGRTLVMFDGSYGIGHTNSDVLPRDVQQHLARMSITVLRGVNAPGRDGQGLSIAVGGGVSTLGAVTDFLARDSTTNYSYRDWSYYWAHSLDVVSRAELSQGGRSVAVHVSASVLRLESRPNNGKDFNAENARVTDSWPRAILRGSLAYPWDRPVLFAQAEYRQRLGQRLLLRAACDFTYASTIKPQPIGLYMNRIQLGLLRPM